MWRETYIWHGTIHGARVVLYSSYKLVGEARCVFLQVDLEHVSEDRTGEGNTQVASHKSKERDSSSTNGNEVGLLVAT